MKSIKILGLAVVAALTAMAFVGASSSMAESTALCEEDETPCASVKISHVHEVSTEKAKLLASPEVQCDVLFLGDVKSANDLGSPLVLQGAFTYSNCGTGCSVTEENGPLTLNILSEGHELSKVTTGTGSGAGLFNVNCSGIQCKYVGSGLVGHGLGPLLSEQENGDVLLNGQTISHESGFFCPSSGKLDIHTTPLSTVYLEGKEAPMECIQKTNGKFFHKFNTGECDPNRYEKVLEHGVWKCVVQANGLYALKNTNELDCENDVNNSQRYELIG